MSFVLECRAFLEKNMEQAIWDKPCVKIKKEETQLSEQLVIRYTDKPLKDGWEAKRKKN